MSSLSYPLFSARWRAVVFCLGLGFSGGASLSGAIVSVNLQQGAGPATPAPSDYTNDPSKAYYGSYSFQNPSSNVFTFSFTNLFLFGGQFLNVTDLAAIFPAPGPYSLGGTLPLSSVAISVTLNDREPASFGTTGETWASDLTILIAPKDGNFSSPLLQVGAGATGLNATTVIPWSDTSDAVPHSFNDVKALTSSIYLSASPAATDQVIWLGSGFDSGAGSSYGKWSGSVTLTFAASGGSGVPDASRTALLLAPGTLFLLGLAGRSRRRG
jgi:hypothetical protein